MARPSSRSAGASTASHSSRTPRATASTGSRLRVRSSQAAIDPAAWASATRRSARVVRPLVASPRRVTEAVRGMPPGPRTASSAGNPVLTTGIAGAAPGAGAPGDLGSAFPGSGTVASAPTVPPKASSPRRGAAAPQRSRRSARAVPTVDRSTALMALMIERMFYSGKTRTARRDARAVRRRRDRTTAPMSEPGTSPSRHGAPLASSPTMLTMTATAQTVLVVDDDPKIRQLVRTYLERDGYAVETAADGQEALAAIDRERPALVVLDLMLPEIDGRAVIRAVRAGADDPDVPILILSARGSVADRIAGLEDGADDYLPKPFSPSELVLRVGAILRRTGSAPEPVSAPARPPLVHGDLVVDRDRHEARIAGTLLSLTRVEFRLLAVLLEADGRVLSRDQLLDAVHGADQVEILDRTIDVHIRRLRDKLGDDPEQPRYVATVRGVGYRAAPVDGA